MARLFVTEYAQMAADRVGQDVPAPLEPAQVEQPAIPIGPDQQRSKPFHPNTRFIAVHADAPCSIAIGEDPVADPQRKRIAANETRYFGVSPKHRLAAIETE